MGNYRFRLSDMMPNAWFYKLKDMSRIANRSKKQHRGGAAAAPPPQPAKLLPGRASLYYSSRAEAERFSFSPTESKALADHFQELPRKSKRGSRKKKLPELAPPETPPREDLDFASGKSDPCCCRVISSATDIIIDLGAGDSVQLDLRPVATKPALQGDAYSAGSDKRQEQRRPSLSSSSPGGARRLRVRANSPRLAHRSRAARRQKKALPESALAVVKTSSDPQRDFRNSMMEMIAEHNIRATTDLEELLACYLSLNSDEYHDLIVKVFEQIWFDLN